MSVLDKARVYKDFVQTSFENAMTTVERIHQTSVAIPIDMLREVGYPPEKAEQIKETHSHLLRILYGGIASAHNELGELVVLQVGQLSKVAQGMLKDLGRRPASPGSTASTVVPAPMAESTSPPRRKPRAPTTGGD